MDEPSVIMKYITGIADSWPDNFDPPLLGLVIATIIICPFVPEFWYAVYKDIFWWNKL